MSLPRAYNCEHTDREHYARGLCTQCYASHRRSGTLDRFPREKGRSLTLGSGFRVCSNRDCVHAGAPQPPDRFKSGKELRSQCLDCRCKWNLHYNRRSRNDYPGLTNNRRNHLSSAFGIRPDQYLALYSHQCGKCCICGDAFKTLWYECVDHCHETGNVCGLLCVCCNTAIGCLREDAETITRAAEYVSSRKRSKRSSAGAA